jgi:hypothetical protein
MESNGNARVFHIIDLFSQYEISGLDLGDAVGGGMYF